MTTRPLLDLDPAVEARIATLIDQTSGADPIVVWGVQYDLGLARVDFPEGRGGLGLESGHQRAVAARLTAAGVPSNWAVNRVGREFVAPTLIAHGTAEQCERFLRPIFTGEEIWCQLFSEPGAGSDLAGLATRARPAADERGERGWTLKGQKVWTGYAEQAAFGFALARSDAEAPKHAGLTCYIVDMSEPGVTVVPLRELTGESEFNEVFLDDVWVADSRQVGESGAGWRVAMATLVEERQSWGYSDMPRGGGLIGEAVRVWRERGHSDPIRRDALTRLWLRAEALRLHSLRVARSSSPVGGAAAGSISKIATAQFNQEVTAFTHDLLGLDGLEYSGYEHAPAPSGDDYSSVFGGEDVARAYLRTRANSIEAGTTEINRNIVAERILGLPGDVKVDRGRPWNEIRRS